MPVWAANARPSWSREGTGDGAEWKRLVEGRAAAECEGEWPRRVDDGEVELPLRDLLDGAKPIAAIQHGLPAADLHLALQPHLRLSVGPPLIAYKLPAISRTSSDRVTVGDV